MVDIPVRQRRGVPAWVWALVALLVIIIALALIDYFVTNIVLGPDAGTQPQRQDDPFGALLTAVGIAPLAALFKTRS